MYFKIDGRTNLRIYSKLPLVNPFSWWHYWVIITVAIALSCRVALSVWLLLFIVWSLLHVHLCGLRVLRTFLDTVGLLFRWWLTAWSLHSSLLGTAWSPFSTVHPVSFPEMFSSLSSAPSSCKVFIVLPPLPEIKGERIVSSSSSSSSTVTTYSTGMTAGIVFILWKWRSMETFFRNFNTSFCIRVGSLSSFFLKKIW